MLIQLIWLVMLILDISNYFMYAYIGFLALSIVMLLMLVGKASCASAKLPWVIIICILPLFGGLFYILFGQKRITARQKARLAELEAQARAVHEGLGAAQRLAALDTQAANESSYIQRYCFAPPYENTETEYLSPGESFFEALAAELEKAQKYIFMEYFIIQQGRMWDTLLEILERKAADGVDVRVMFDDVGCVQTLPFRYERTLRQKGIKCAVFNSFKPTLSTAFNYRDHRKITVIDGVTGFTGGVNLADEYINEFVKYGHWKDAAVMLKGEAVLGLTTIFLETWAKAADEDEDFLKYRSDVVSRPSAGYCQPFMDSPFDDELVSETIFLNIISSARESVYIETPYLVLDDVLLTALQTAAKRGVDVRIITPHIPDKWMVQAVSRSYYKSLADAGVRIYEYAPGFIHSKTLISDGIKGVIGTVNMDYRSLYHHMECGVWLYKADCLHALREEFMRTLEVCIPATEEFCHGIPFSQRFVRSLIMIFAPLM